MAKKHLISKQTFWDSNMRLFPNILAASFKLKHWLTPTPLRYSYLLSQETGMDVYLKLENQQPTNSFKVRGALNKILSILSEARLSGIVAASTGNQGLAIAYVSNLVGDVDTTIFLPSTAPQSKVIQYGQYKVNIHLQGNGIEEAYSAAEAFCSKSGGLLINVFDDPDIVSGNGTLALELFEVLPDLSAILVPVGSGQLISGITIVSKSIMPEVEVIGVQPEASPVLELSLRDGKYYEYYPASPTICDGLAGGIGPRVYELARDGLIDRVINVDEVSIRNAILCFNGKRTCSCRRIRCSRNSSIRTIKTAFWVQGTESGRCAYWW